MKNNKIEYLGLYRKKFIIIFIVSFLLVWKLLLFLNLPFVNGDGPWTLSKLFSFLNGQREISSFGHNYAGAVFKVHVFEYINAPFFYLYPNNTNSIIFHSFFMILVSIMLVFYIFWIKSKNTLLFFIVSAAILTSTYTFGMRVESYCMPLILTVISLTSPIDPPVVGYRFVIIIAICVLVSLMHPAAAITSGLCLMYWLVFHKAKWSIFVLGIIIGLFFLFVFSEGNLSSYIKLFSSSNELDNHTFTLFLLPKFLLQSLGVIPLIFIALRTNFRINSIAVILFIAVLLFFGRSYYFYYLFAFTILLIYLNRPMIEADSINNKKFLRLSLFLIFVSLITSHVYPSVIQVENPDYSIKFKQILSKTKDIQSNMNDKNLIWVPAQLGMEVIQKPNSRLYFNFYRKMAEKGITLKEGDVMLFLSENKLNQLIPELLDNDLEQVQITEIIPPTKGQLRIASLLRSRADSIGLWKVSIK